MSIYVIYAGESSEDYGLLVYQRPNYRTAQETITEFDIPGRESNLHRRSGHFDTTKIDVTFNYVAEPTSWGEVLRKTILWLRKSGNLQFSDDLDVFRKVINVEIGDNERQLKRYGRFDATFNCAPGEYYVAGQEFYDYADVTENPYSECRPVYKITGNGGCTITVNGNSMTAAVDTNLVIDTGLKIAAQEGGETLNTSVTGDYDGLVLNPGSNTIEFTGAAILTVQPNWRVL